MYTEELETALCAAAEHAGGQPITTEDILYALLMYEPEVQSIYSDAQIDSKTVAQEFTQNGLYTAKPRKEITSDPEFSCEAAMALCAAEEQFRNIGLPKISGGLVLTALFDRFSTPASIFLRQKPWLSRHDALSAVCQKQSKDVPIPQAA